MATREPSPGALPPEISAALARIGLLTDDVEPRGEPLSGGVSSDVWRVDLSAGPVCAKRALPQLKVAGDWRAPVSRGAWEARWLQLASQVSPGSACELIAYDAEAGVVVMEWLEPDRHPVWKDELAAGRVDVQVAGAAGARLASLHSGARRAGGLDEWAEAKPLFRVLRIEPYLRTVAQRHHGVGRALDELCDQLGSAEHTVIHGDVSPKNMLVGADGPVLIDAECASLGDPAFDVAFCANHLLLKALWLPGSRADLLASADALFGSYLGAVDWEPVEELERRMLHLLPALALARVDGLSPVEYLDDAERSAVRTLALALLGEPPSTHRELTERWLDGCQDGHHTPTPRPAHVVATGPTHTEKGSIT